MTSESPILEVDNLCVSFPTRLGLVQAVRDISFAIGRGERIGVVGESGSGKSVCALAIAGLLPRSAQVSGSIRLGGRELTTLRGRRRRELGGSEIGMIFQNPLNSLNPSMTVGEQIAEVLRIRSRRSRAQAKAEAVGLLGETGIPEPERSCSEYPHRFSGGMRQRVMIAMALAARPGLIIADEPTTALDVTIQAEILELLVRVCDEHGASLIMITHDLGVLAGAADRVIVMYGGRILEHGPVDDIYYDPTHPYTWALLASTTRLDRPRDRLAPIPGDPPSALVPPPGCPFHPRCVHAAEICHDTTPRPVTVGSGHESACHFARQLTRPFDLSAS